ncbi:MAG: glutamate synthase (NADPH), homotetrameric [Dethiosulfovibrio peptidovorans]|nr:MAG: glutamate synthase (NADPH), homotetrameric [Dethiosulfovibrio peptidovorans]
MAICRQRTPIGEQAPEIRARNFKEVCFGYTEEEAVQEASRCLNCKNAPCVKGCPVSIDIPGFIGKIKERDFNSAWEILSQSTALPAVCGRVCPQENQCEGPCTMGKIKGSEPVAIGKLERFIADWKADQAKQEIPQIPYNGKGKVAVVGSGPSSLTVAGELRKRGYGVTVFEALHAPGGVLMYGIPEFRLPKSIVQREIENIKDMGVSFEMNVLVGRTLPVEELLKEYDSIYIATGAGTPNFSGVPGTNLNGIFSASEYLTRINLMHGYEFPKYDTPIKKSRHVVVIGGGNVAMDAARSALRLGAESVTVAYRRSENELPARIEEYHHAVEEGVQFNFLTAPLEYLSQENNKVCEVKFIRMELGEPDSSGRRRPQPIQGSEFVMEADTVIEAIGQSSNRVLMDAWPELKVTKRGYIEADEALGGGTSVEGVYAGGDIVTGAATVILAMGAGKTAAQAIDEYLSNKAAQ